MVSAEQEEEFNLTARASHRDRSWGVLTKTPRGRSSPTLVTFYPKGGVKVVLPYGECWLYFALREAATLRVAYMNRILELISG